LIIIVGNGHTVIAQRYDTWPIVNPDSVRNAILRLEKDAWLHQKHMYEMDKNQLLVKSVQEICGDQVIWAIDRTVMSLWWAIEQRFAQYSQAEVLFYTEQLYNKIQDAHHKVLDLWEAKEICQGKYLLYWIQMWLRTRHILLLQSTWLINELDDAVDASNEQHGAIKKEYLDLMNHAQSTNKERLWLSIPFFITKNEQENWFTPFEKELAERTQKLIESVMYATLADMIQKRVLRAKDLGILLPNISFYWRRGCDQFHWAYNVILVYSSQWVRVDTRFNGLEIQVNMCNNFFVLKDFYEYFSQIITHELWHHIYYFRDANTQAFEELCWDWEITRNTRCTKNDFVSDYAQTMASEDYAESFMVRYHQTLSPNTPILEKKLGHFEELFKNIY
jgi:hypothetical protein